MKSTRSIPLLLLLFCLAITQSTSQSTTTNTTAAGDPSTIITAANVAKPGCQKQCGNVTIPYPFGIGPNCFLSRWFEITCNTTFNPPKPFIGGLSILEITDSAFRVATKVASKCYDQFGNVTEDDPVTTNIGWTSPFTFAQRNQFTLIGCDDIAVFQGPLQANFTSGCLALCTQPEQVSNGSCDGVGCCQISVPKGIKYYAISLASSVTFTNHMNIWSFNPCTYSFMSERDRFPFHGVSDFMDPNFKTRTKATVPMLVDWVIGNLTCSEARNSGVLIC